jgi:hypothetical protein
MTTASDQIRDASSARAVLRTYEVVSGIYVLGSLSTGVTVYRQQVRAHNLASALKHLAAANELKLRDVAVVGGGIGGMTTAAALIALDPDVKVTLFEKRWDLCPLQQGCDTRWLHPKIYDWPALGSRFPSSDLAVLGWKEGRASDVASTILRGFASYCMWSGTTHGDPTARGPERLRVFLGLSHLSVDGSTRRIEWMGHLAERQGNHFRARNPEGDTHQFDVIIVATGFGLELGHNPDQVHSLGSYWRSDMLGQPALAGTKVTYVISGYGDGGIVDLCRLTIERFRQDTILDELFGEKLEEVEDRMRSIVVDIGAEPGKDLKTIVEQSNQDLIALVHAASQRLSHRVRKDTTVVLHAQGIDRSPRSVAKIFGYPSAIANRLLLYMLYRAGAFLVRFTDIESVKREFAVSAVAVVQRHGASAREAVLDLFVEPTILVSSLDEMKKRNDQSVDHLFPLGSFPKAPEGAMA